MRKRSLALALIAITGFAASGQAQTLQLSDVPPGAIHTPGIGPGYMYPTYPIPALGAGSDGASGAAMMPGSTMAVDQMPVMGSSRDQVLARFRSQGFSDVRNLRQIDGAWYGTVPGGKETVILSRDGVISVEKW